MTDETDETEDCGDPGLVLLWVPVGLLTFCVAFSAVLAGWKGVVRFGVGLTTLLLFALLLLVAAGRSREN